MVAKPIITLEDWKYWTPSNHGIDYLWTGWGFLPSAVCLIQLWHGHGISMGPGRVGKYKQICLGKWTYDDVIRIFSWRSMVFLNTFTLWYFNIAIETCHLWFTNEKWWFSIIFLVNQRVYHPQDISIGFPQSRCRTIGHLEGGWRFSKISKRTFIHTVARTMWGPQTLAKLVY